ncbi:MAG TPA: metallophosphoesterase [Tepidisphaeraceae bacterium]|nr:metallophosphoesterase [Tepidisphaeraceae bacterium]
MRTIAHISDLHFGRDDPPVIAALVDDLRQYPFDLLICSGDFTQRARVGQYRAAAEFMKRLPGPQIMVPGNHDIPLWNVVRRFASPLGRYRRLINDNLWPVYQDVEIFVLGINTARPLTASLKGFWKDGKISSSQLIEVRRIFSQAPSTAMKILVTHHPFIPPKGPAAHNIVHGARRALAELESCGVDILLAGHLHLGYVGDVRAHHEAVRRSILSIQAGTAISTRRRNEPNAYNVISIEPNRVDIEIRAFDGQKFAAQSTRHFNRMNDVWTES